MVCVPCIVIPLVLWVMRLLQPYLMPYMPESVQKWFKYNMKAYGPVTEKGEGETTNKPSCPMKSNDETLSEANGTMQNGHAAEIPCGPDKKTD